MNMLHTWMIAQRELVHEGVAIAKALDYSLKRWTALSRYLDDGAVPIDNNHIEQQIRPWALGRKNWLFAGSLRSGQRAAALMSLIQSAKLNGHDPYAYLKDVLMRLPTQRASEIAELLPVTQPVMPVRLRTCLASCRPNSKHPGGGKLHGYFYFRKPLKMGAAFCTHLIRGVEHHADCSLDCSCRE